MDSERPEAVLALKPSVSMSPSRRSNASVTLQFQATATTPPQPLLASATTLEAPVGGGEVRPLRETESRGMNGFSSNEDKSKAVRESTTAERDSSGTSCGQGPTPPSTIYGQQATFARASAGGAVLVLPSEQSRTRGHEQGPLQDLSILVEDTINRLKKVRVKLRLGASGKRLLSGAIAGGVSRTVVAPLETIRTHLMVGSTKEKSVGGVFKWILETEGWRGLFRGNGINVLRVAPSKAIELYMYDTVKKALTPKEGERVPRLILPFPPSSIAGSCAGIASCTLMYPLELVKTRLTVQKGAYKGITDAFVTIVRQEGFLELYRGLFASIVGVIPYAGCNYFAYDTLRNLYKKVRKKERIGNLATLVIGSSAGAFAASATFPLEVARKQMQMGTLNGRVVYKNTLECMLGILREQGPKGLYRGLAPSCIKLMPAAGISFMCYEALKRILLEEDSSEDKKTKSSA